MTPSAHFFDTDARMSADADDDDAMTALRAHCARRLAKGIERASARMSSATREALFAVVGATKRTDDDDDVTVDPKVYEYIVNGVFALAAEEARDDARTGKRRKTSGNDDDGGDGERGDSRRRSSRSAMLGYVRTKTEALAANASAEHTRCAEVFATAAKTVADGATEDASRMEALKTAILKGLEASERDRARAVWRREVVVSHHKALRAAARSTEEDADESWKRCVGSDGAEALRKYSEAATEIGNRAWVLSALEWSVDAMGRYFGDGGECVGCGKSNVEFSWKLANKRRARALAKARGCDMRDVIDEVEGDDARGTPDRSVRGKAIKVFDVGSCWDYYGSHFKHAWPGGLRVETLACDLRPSVPSVFECDWLRVRVSEPQREIADPAEGSSFRRLLSVESHGVDALVFSLVLSYVPTPKQRGEMVRRARLALKNRGEGLLFIMTPHSTDKGHSPHNALPILKEWRHAIEAIGFERVLYDRHKSLHCLCFRTIGDGDEARAAESDPPLLRIAFDNQVVELPSKEANDA